MKVLSTKILSPAQQSHLMLADIALVQFDAIQVVPTDFKAPKNISSAIVSSHNAVKQLMSEKITAQNWYCVGEKSKNHLIQNGQNVAKTAQNASELADFITKYANNDEFLFFCGDRKRDELPDILRQNDVRLKLLEIYRTELNPQRISGDFDAILFFSPSAVQSFVSLNTMNNCMAFCIGHTTANEALKHTSNIVVAKKATIDNVLIQLIKYKQHA